MQTHAKSDAHLHWPSRWQACKPTYKKHRVTTLSMAFSEPLSVCQAQAWHLTTQQQIWELRVISPTTQAQSSLVTQWRNESAGSRWDPRASILFGVAQAHYTGQAPALSLIAIWPSNFSGLNFPTCTGDNKSSCSIRLIPICVKWHPHYLKSSKKVFGTLHISAQ